jgi:hypothetical protein
MIMKQVVVLRMEGKSYGYHSQSGNQHYQVIHVVDHVLLPKM